MENKRDIQVQALFKIVQQKKAEIAKAEKPNWQTNSSFSFYRNGSDRINIQTVSDIEVLIDALACLKQYEKFYAESAKQLGVESTFKWLGFTLEQWESDFQTRVNKIQISAKKKEFEMLEGKLNALISPELKAQMELDEITKMLS